MTNFKNQIAVKSKKLWQYFTTYEKIWLLVFSVVAIISSILIPEETTNGISGTFITIICLINVIFGLFCELLASKQSKWSFFLYIFVEIIEIAICIMLAYRFSSMIVSIFFWFPMHIVSYIVWKKHEDKKDKEKTVVRSMNVKHAALLFLGVLGWTLCLGSIFAFFGPDSEIFSTEIQQVAVAYIDACISALSIANGILLFFRFKESWLVWLIASILYIIVAIITNTWILLVLYIGYLINTIYGSFCWKKYLDKKDNNKELQPQEPQPSQDQLSAQDQA